jgi:hypothetical protein
VKRCARRPPERRAAAKPLRQFTALRLAGVQDHHHDEEDFAFIPTTLILCRDRMLVSRAVLVGHQNQTFRHELAGGYLWSPKRRPAPWEGPEDRSGGPYRPPRNHENGLVAVVTVTGKSTPTAWPAERVPSPAA